MILQGDCRTVLQTLKPQSVQCCITSPPYFCLRDYQVEGQIGLERTPEAYISELVCAFGIVRRVLADDGVLWCNIGDSYAASGRGGGGGSLQNNAMGREISEVNGFRMPPPGYKQKDLIGIPWMLAFALRGEGWYLRSDIIWAKPNPMPESVQDRPTKAHEYLFLLTKSASYYYNAAAIREPYAESTVQQFEQPYEGEATKDYAAVGVQNPSAIKKRITDKQRGHSRRHAGFDDRWDAMTKQQQQQQGANKRSVWTIPTSPFPGAHFATFPEALVEPCILAGSRQGDTVLDPFCGAGTVGVVCAKAQRQFIGIELNAEYVAIAERRIAAVAPLFAEHVEAAR